MMHTLHMPHGYLLVIAIALLLFVGKVIDGLIITRDSQKRTRYASDSAALKATISSDLTATRGFEAIQRGDFPILDQKPNNGKDLIYLDSAASSQKPNFVLEAMHDYYTTSHSNVHRGAHALAVRATDKFEEARFRVQAFVNAARREEIVFTRGATEAINLVAYSWGETFLRPGDEIILSVMEHHANLVPWQFIAKRTGAVLKFVQLTKDMQFDVDHFHSLISPGKTKLVAVVHASNVLGCVNPVKEIISAAHNVGAKVLLDACQSVPNMPIDVQQLDVDFLVASAHKMCGPTGIGFLYAKHSLLEQMPPLFGGGEMIDQVQLTSSTFAAPPSRFEAGTPAIAEAVGLGAACEYLKSIGMDRIHQHETALGSYLYDQLATVDGLELYGPSTAAVTSSGGRTGLVAFNSKAVHATDLSFFLDQEGVAVRTGHHCAQPLHRILGVPGSIRASLYFYNSKSDVDAFIVKLQDTIRMFEDMK